MKVECAMVSLLVVLHAPAARADPIAIWTQPWQVILRTPIQSGNATAERAFGASSMAGQIAGTGAANESLSGTGAVAKSHTAVTAAFLTLSTAQAGVDFSRDFQLSGSPSGWSVTLSGNLNGSLLASNADLNPSASVQAFATVPGLRPLIWNSTATAQTLDPRNFVFSLSRSSSGPFGDGTYTVGGSLLTTSRIDPALFSNGRAEANFFNSLEINVSASPVPEPATVTLLLIGSGTGYLQRVRRRGSPAV